MGSSIKGRQVGSFVLTIDEDQQLDIVDECTYRQLSSFQERLLKELDEELKILKSEVAESSSYCLLLLDELTQYQRCETEIVSYGLNTVSKNDAIDSTQKLVNNARIKIVMLNQQIAGIEDEREALVTSSEESQLEAAPQAGQASVAIAPVVAFTAMAVAVS